MKNAIVDAILCSIAGLSAVACSPAAVPPSASPVAAALARDIYVYKSPTCSCCHEWEGYMESNGYTVHSVPTMNMSEIKAQMSVPEGAWSCHTAVIDGYVVEGHVPLEAIEDLLASHPDIDGIALAGMPAGSPGMPGVKAGPLEVLAVEGGETTAFGAY